MMKGILIAGCLLALAGHAAGGIHTEEVEYRQGSTVLQGYLAYDSSLIGQGVRPGVLVIHEWTGITDYIRERVRQLAELGYVAFAADIYGKGVRPEGPEAAGTEARKYYQDPKLFRERLQAGLDVLVAHELSDDSRIAAIGYCFGGAGVLELARSGAQINGVVSFHGSLATSQPAGLDQVKGKVLVLHGAADPNVPAEQVAGFISEMDAAGVDWQLVMYGGAVHGFTNPKNTPGNGSVAYDEDADRRSWEHMKVFFEEIFD